MSVARTRGDEQAEKKCIAILLLICVLLYLLARSFGSIEHNGIVIPNTGGVDVFEISCDCCREDVRGEHSEREHSGSDYSGDEYNNGGEYEDTNGNIIVYDDYKIWDNKELRIFANPIYGYNNIIAPGSHGSYAFIIRNNNGFNIVVDIIFDEMNNKKINMQYKLVHQDNYLLGAENEYEKIAGVKIDNVELSAKSEQGYVLDWKWVDDDYNDTLIGFDVTAFYKLKITIGSR